MLRTAVPPRMNLASPLQSPQCTGRRLLAAAPILLGVSALLVAGCQHGDHHMVNDKSPTTQGAVSRATFVRPLPDAEDGGRLLAPPDSVVMRSGLVVLQPGANCGWHSTNEYEEMLICLEGSGEVRSEGQAPSPLSAGQYAYNPPRTRHNVFNTGQGRIRYIYIVSQTSAKAE